MASNEQEPLLNLQRELQPKPPLSRPMLYTLVAALGPLAFGYTVGYTSPVGDDLEDPDSGLGISSSNNDLFGSSMNIGAMVGALLGGVMCDKLGRTWTIRLACIPFVLGYLLIFFAKDFSMLLAGRLLDGVGVGIVSLAVPVYISEIAPAEYRGTLGAANQLSITVGIVIAYALGLIAKWRILALIGAIIPAILFFLSFVLPQTPHWLVARGRQADARSSLLTLRGANAHALVDSELSKIVESHTASLSAESATFGELFKGATRRAMVVGAILMIFQQFSGVNAVFFFNASIFKDAGVSNAAVASLSVSAVQVVFTILALLLIDRAGRRILLMFAGIGISSSCAILGYYFYMKDHDHEISGILAVLMVIVYVIFFSLGLGAVPWVMMGEIFPSRVRGLASSCATLLNWSCAFIITEAFSSMKSAMSEAGVFWFYGCICACGSVYVLFGVPETKGRTLEQIERYFNGDYESIPKDQSGTKLVVVTAICGVLATGIAVLTTSL